ncbi:MAG TPA: SGNH/GDSL hydrolase family protein, partial [Gemmatimonadaceae bacterium]|nr:SGNH/GDSL hydrolase family protein [Gemmatimonadaceae bacterium]
MKKRRLTLVIASTIALAACSDGRVSPLAADVRPAENLSPKAASYMSNYVAVGTSVSMGWADDGVVGSSQRNSWPLKLAEQVGVAFTVPAIAEPGCPPPLAPPLISFRRTDGTSAGPSTVCAPNEPGVTLPTHNLAVEGATTAEALNATPATAQPGKGPVTSRVLPPGMTQMTAMHSLNPTFVSVEFGGNEILPAQVGLLYPGVTFTPLSVFTANYSQIIDNVQATGAKAVLTTLRLDLRNFPTIRTGPEVASQRSAFAAYNVTVNADCNASPNFIFVRGKVLTAIITGITRAGFGLGPYDLSCADIAGTADYVLTPTDISSLNTLAAQMSDAVESEAAENGYATFSLGVLYDRSKEDVPFDLSFYLTSDTPYGPFISLDGVHPTAKGQTILARAARQA